MSMNPFGSGFHGGFSLMAALFPIIFLLIFGTIVGIFVTMAVKGAKRYKHNNASPVLTVDAKVVAKRADVRHRMHDNDSMAHRSSTDYYVTFEVESGDRIELEVTSQEYGMLVEADCGKLTFQGTRYKGFARIR